MAETQQELLQVRKESPREFDNLDWAYNYEIPWELMPTELHKLLEKKKRLTPGLRRHLIQVVTDNISKSYTKPGRKALSIVARNMVQKYPESLSDTLCGEVVGEGHLSIEKQMEVRFDNKNRTSQYNTLKRKMRSNNVEKKVKQSDAYGCVNWMPDFPENETEETLEEKRKRMLQKPPSKVLDVDSKKLLNDTFYSQRKEINSRTPVEELMKRWPLLFTNEGLCQHFLILMEINFYEKFNDSLSRKGYRIFSYLKTLPQKKNIKKMESVLETCSNNKETDILTLLRLLAIYFDEDVGQILCAVDVSIFSDYLANHTSYLCSAHFIFKYINGLQ